jgi:broad specificity phosphatase PhoE
METAAPLAASRHRQVEMTADLLDIDYGAWEGLARETIRERFPDMHSAWVKTPGRVKFPGGESVRQVRLRLENLLSELMKDHRGETVALISHRVTCHIALAVALGLSNDSIWRIRQDVACINEFEERGGLFVVTLMNDTDHLHD